MNGEQEITALLAEIVGTGLLRIRAAGWAGNAERCALEADHLHNLPGLFQAYSLERLRFYLEVERLDFIRQCTATQINVQDFEPLWQGIQDHVNEFAIGHEPLTSGGVA